MLYSRKIPIFSGLMLLSACLLFCAGNDAKLKPADQVTNRWTPPANVRPPRKEISDSEFHRLLSRTIKIHTGLPFILNQPDDPACNTGILEGNCDGVFLLGKERYAIDTRRLRDTCEEYFSHCEDIILNTMLRADVPIQSPIRTSRVKNARELAAAIGPRKRIIIEADIELHELDGKKQTNPFVWQGRYARGEFRRKIPSGLTVFGVHTLILEGAGTERRRVVTQNSSANVLELRAVRNASVRNLEIGHSLEPSQCFGVALLVANSHEISIQNSELFGSGIIGLFAVETINLTLSKSDITDNNTNALWIRNSHQINILQNHIYANRTYGPLIEINRSSNVVFNQNRITNNSVRDPLKEQKTPLFEILSSRSVGISKNTRQNNRYDQFILRK